MKTMHLIFDCLRPRRATTAAAGVPLRVFLAGLLIACGAFAPQAQATPEKPKLAILSTSFVLDAKFRLLADAAAERDLAFGWIHVDAAGPAEIARVLEGADIVLIDAPRDSDIAAVEAGAGEAVRASGLPVLRVSVMNRASRLAPAGLSSDTAERIFGYYVGGTRSNHRNLASYLVALIGGGDVSVVPRPVELPNGGIYHPDADGIFADLPAYLAWWQSRSGGQAEDKPVIGMETSSSYISDGQTRMLDDIVAGIEAKGAIPLVFYRSSRVARARSADGAGRPESDGGKPRDAGTARPDTDSTGSGRARRDAAGTTDDAASPFPNPRADSGVVEPEPLVTLDGRPLPDVLFVNTFIGSNPDARKAWHQSMGIPVIHIMNYREGDSAAYKADRAGINAFSLPFTLTTSEYIGMQDPVLLSANDDGEIVPMPEQLELVLSKAMRLAKLRHTANADKRVAMVYWNTPAGETNMGGSNLNLPRSMLKLAAAMRDIGYDIGALDEEEIIDRARGMVAPRYRAEAMTELVRGADWAFLPMQDYRDWFGSLPEEVRKRIEDYWGRPEQSQWLTMKDGRLGFIIPRLQSGKLTILPQPTRGPIPMEGMEDMERDLFHDDKVPVNHPYLAAYLWLRMNADALVHFGTHGSQEWTPGKERGLWAHDDPQLLAGDIPILYPYIVDNIGEAIHVKRRGRGVIASHQTPAFAPAGLSPDLAAVNDLFREYHTVVEGPAREQLRHDIAAKATEMHLDRDLGLSEGALEADFDAHARNLETLLEDMGSAMQPLGLHTFGEGPDEPEHLAANIMQMMGQPFYDALGVDPGEIFRADHKTLASTVPMRFVLDHVLGDRPADPALAEWVEKGRKYRDMLYAGGETRAVLTGLSSGWIDPSYGGDPIRNPDALPTGRNVYGFDPSRVPTRNAYRAAASSMEELIATHAQKHGAAPKKLAFSLWSTETMRHLGLLEAQIMVAMGVRPVWDEGGRVTGVEVIPTAQLGRPRVDPVISITGLYRDQFPNVMKLLNQAVVAVNALDEPAETNPLRANTARIADALRAKGVEDGWADAFALTRIFGNESGNYGTGLPDATLKSGEWDENDGQLANGYLMRMSWGYGPDESLWSQRAGDGKPGNVNAYAEQLAGTDAAVFSRSSNLRGMLDTDHPFEYLGGLSLAIRHIDGESPQLYISNMRDPNRTRLQTAEAFMAGELRAVYQHPRWVAEMKDEGYAGTLALLKTVNNFWGWQAMDRNVVRDDQWQEFLAVYVEDRYELGVREWFEKTNPEAMAQIAERMIEAIRKGYWQAGEESLRALVETYADIAARHTVKSDNAAFNAFLVDKLAGFGLAAVLPAQAQAEAPAKDAAGSAQDTPPQGETEVVTGQELREEAKAASPAPPQYYALIPLALIAAGFAWRSLRLSPGNLLDWNRRTA
ncbi:MAG: cobaltochelatase subunit CobN [Notoacmeibacter sp.]|nr:cobaltochelatase subunit CobN [Notoacmeibacter sp.]